MASNKPQSGDDGGWSVADDQFNKLLEKEQQKDGGSEDQAAQREQEQLNNSQPDQDSGEDGQGEHGRRRRVRISRRQALVLAGSGLGVGGGMWVFTVAQGPLQLIHLSQLLQGFHFTSSQEFEGGRNFRFIRHLIRGTPHRSRLGTMGNKYADRIELRMNERSGLRSVYDRRTGRFVGYEVIDEEKARQHLADFEADEVPVEDGVPDNTVGPNSRDDRFGEIDRNHRFVNFRGADRSVRKRSIKTVLKAQRILHIPGGLSARMLIKRAGVDFHPIEEFKRRRGEDLVDYWDRRKEKRAQDRKRGVEAPEGRLEGQDGDEDDDGENDRDDTRDDAAEGNDFADEAADADTPSKRNNLVSRLLRGGGILAAFASALCIINDISGEIDIYQYENIILPLIRIGMDTIATGDQLMSSGLAGLANSEVSMDELSAFASDLNQVDEETGKKTNWACSASIQKELGKEPTCPDIDEEARPSGVGEKNFLFRFTDRMGSILDTACGVSDAIGSIPIVGDVIELSSSVVEGAIDAALGIFDTSTAELYDAVVSFFAGDVVEALPKGPDLGNQANYGAFLANKDYITGLGGAPLKEEENHRIKVDTVEALELERKDKSFFARVFDVTDAYSMTAVAMREMPQSPSQTLAAMFSAPFKFFGNFFTPAYADHVNIHDYGVDNSGFTKEEQEDPRVEDPFENAEIVEPDLDEVNEEYKECFGMKVIKRTNDEGEEDLGLVMSDFQNQDDKEAAAKRYKDIPDKCKRRDENNDHIEDREPLLRYRFFIADTVQRFTIACKEGSGREAREACKMLTTGVPDEEADSGGGGGGATGSGCNPNGPPVPQSETVEVAPGMRVNRCIESNIRSLLAAAQGAGVSLGGSGWRDTRRQQELYIANCGSLSAPRSACSPPTATPGNSQHERGLAMDFTCGGGTVRHGDACWNFLVANAAQYGLQNLPSESWHWSTTGR